MEELKAGWKKVNLGDIIEVQKGYAFKSKDFLNKGIKIIKVSNLENETINFLDCACISEENFEKYKKYALNYKDIIITTVGSWPNNKNSVVGKVVRVPQVNEKLLLNQNAIRVTALEKYLQEYIYYALKDSKFKYYIEGVAQGSANQASITLEDIKEYELKIPSLKVQKKIVSILASLDEKIELNRKINQNLEEAAQTLFKRWFIDFEFPNEEGKPYKSSGGKMIESELGEIPEGWRVGKLGEIIEINPKENLKKLEKKIYIEMKCLSETSSIISEYYEREFTGTGTKFKNKDTLMARITPCLENGKIGYVNFLKDNDIGWGSTEFNILRSQNNLPKELSYFIARSKNFLDYAISNMNGSSGRQRVNGKILEEYNIVISPENIYKKFGKVSNSIMNQIENNRKEIEKLIELRDYLLPRLMSGEISV